MRAIPWAAVTLCLFLLAGSILTVCGVYVLAGQGWALVAGAVTCFLPAGVLLRGVLS